MTTEENVGRAIGGTVVRPKRQLAMVFDLNKCLGCHTCAIACKTQWTREPGTEHMWWATVNTQPGHGTPKDWEGMGGGFEGDAPRPGRLPTGAEFGEAWRLDYEGMIHDDARSGGAIRVRGEKPTWGPNWDEDQGGGEHPNSYYFYLPRICNHCTHPACLEACPRRAIYKRAEDGIVLIDESRCKGYRFCMEACPYKKIYFNHVRAISQKCIFCFPRIEKGVAPACARQCPGRLRFVGYLDDETGPIHRLVKRWKVALPLHAEYGTEPNVYYVPPLSPPRFDASGEVDESNPRIPPEYLRALFGDGVDAALATLKAEMARKQAGETSELLDTLIVHEWSKGLFPDFPNDPVTLERSAREA